MQWTRRYPFEAAYIVCYLRLFRKAVQSNYVNKARELSKYSSYFIHSLSVAKIRLLTKAYIQLCWDSAPCMSWRPCGARWRVNSTLIWSHSIISGRRSHHIFLWVSCKILLVAPSYGSYVNIRVISCSSHLHMGLSPIYVYDLVHHTFLWESCQYPRRTLFITPSSGFRGYISLYLVHHTSYGPHVNIRRGPCSSHLPMCLMLTSQSICITQIQAIRQISTDYEIAGEANWPSIGNNAMHHGRKPLCNKHWKWWRQNHLPKKNTVR